MTCWTTQVQLKRVTERGSEATAPSRKKISVFFRKKKDFNAIESHLAFFQIHSK